VPPGAAPVSGRRPFGRTLNDVATDIIEVVVGQDRYVVVDHDLAKLCTWPCSPSPTSSDHR
jgi:hypothetical protein